MADKIWRYKYLDTVTVIEKFDDSVGKVVGHRDSKHNPPFDVVNVGLSGTEDGDECFIFSDSKIGACPKCDQGDRLDKVKCPGCGSTEDRIELKLIGTHLGVSQ